MDNGRTGTSFGGRDRRFGLFVQSSRGTKREAWELINFFAEVTEIRGGPTRGLVNPSMVRGPFFPVLSLSRKHSRGDREGLIHGAEGRAWRWECRGCSPGR